MLNKYIITWPTLTKTSLQKYMKPDAKIFDLRFLPSIFQYPPHFFPPNVDFGLDFDTQTMCLIGGSGGFFQSLKKLKSPLIFPGNQPFFVAHNFKFHIFAHTQITMEKCGISK